MRTGNRFGSWRNALTLIEVIVTTVIFGLLVMLGPPLRHHTAKIARITSCTDNLARISQAVAMCEAEHNGYGPTYDDGNGVASFMLTWTDLLYDMRYLRSLNSQRCPDDDRPDYVTEARGQAWQFSFVERMGVNDPVKYGARTSYALNYHMSLNHAEDRFEDTSRQVYAIDGWWTWFSCLNAAWVLSDEVTGESYNPVNWPNWSATMVGWRHGLDHTANVLYVDGHVAPLTPIVPDDLEGLLNDTVDTMQSFTWLPGERTIRFAYDYYQGEVEEYWGRRPYSIQQGGLPADHPNELDLDWRTDNEAWLRLPNDERDRR